MISSADGKPNGPVRLRLLLAPGVGSSLGNVGAVPPLGVCRITLIVGSCVSFACSRASRSVVSRVS